MPSLFDRVSTLASAAQLDVVVDRRGGWLVADGVETAERWEFLVAALDGLPSTAAMIERAGRVLVERTAADSVVLDWHTDLVLGELLLSLRTWTQTTGLQIPIASPA